MTFTYTVTAADWARITPELVLAAFALLVMITDLLLPQQGESVKERGAANFVVLPLVSLLGLAGAFVATIVLYIVGDHQTAFNNMINSDPAALYAYIIILSASILGILFSPAYLKRLNLIHQGEYYALFLLATTGMMLLAAAASFLIVFLGLELLSLALYILCSFVTRRKSSQESGMKYFLLSSFASAFLLYGIALTYASTGNTSFSGVSNALFNQRLPDFGGNPVVYFTLVRTLSFHAPTLLLVAMGLLIVGFAFKVSAIPFQAWTPDVYEGAPAPVTAFMSVGTKAAALIAFARIFAVVFFYVRGDWEPVVWAITILTIVGGNILALVQSNVKRMLAYSSISHAGYLLIGVVVANAVGVSALLFYLLCYTFLNLGAFGVVSVLERIDNSGSNYSDIRGLWYRNPVLAGLLAFFMLALAGFPPMAGFAAKYYIFYAALVGGHPELLIIGVLASVLGMYYYLRVIAVMFMEKEPAVAPSALVTPAPLAGKPVSGKLTSGKPTTATTTTSVRAGAATAVAVKPAATAAATGSRKQTVTVAGDNDISQNTRVGWMSWIGLVLAVAGTLLMGTVLPFWLVQLAQQAAQIMGAR
jgi:NADH-quinone oxidoreductase subunit N